jgi:hypothetical protein
VALGSMVLLVVFGLSAGHRLEALAPPAEISWVTFAIWQLWWPLLALSALTVGRAWCLVCPNVLLSRCGHFLAQKVGVVRRPLPQMSERGWVGLLVFLTLQVLVDFFAVHQSARATSATLCALGLLALFSGVAWANALTFCRSLCPVGTLLTLYARFAPLCIGAANRGACRACVSHQCGQQTKTHRSSPQRGRPSQAQFQAIPQTKRLPILGGSVSGANVHLVAHPQALERRRQILLPAEAVLVVVMTGLLGRELAEEIPWLDDALRTAPRLLAELLPRISGDCHELAWWLAIAPLLVWAPISLLTSWTRGESHLGKAFLSAATWGAPVVALAHMVKAVRDLSRSGQFACGFCRDPRMIGNEPATAASGGPLTSTAIVQFELLALVGVAWLLLRTANPAVAAPSWDSRHGNARVQTINPLVEGVKGTRS